MNELPLVCFAIPLTPLRKGFLLGVSVFEVTKNQFRWHSLWTSNFSVKIKSNKELFHVIYSTRRNSLMNGMFDVEPKRWSNEVQAGTDAVFARITSSYVGGLSRERWSIKNVTIFCFESNLTIGWCGGFFRTYGISIWKCRCCWLLTDWRIGQQWSGSNHNRHFEFQIGTEGTQRPIDLEVIIEVKDAVLADVCRWYFRDPDLNGSQTFYPKRAFFEGTLDHNHFVVYSIHSIELREICDSL